MNLRGKLRKRGDNWQKMLLPCEQPRNNLRRKLRHYGGGTDGVRTVLYDQ
jgi:hypothetical protein